MSRPVMPTRILVVGGGGREHALAWKLASEPGVNDVIVVPGSDGIAEEDRVACVPMPAAEPGAIVDLCRSRSIELVVVGPEQPLADGLVDVLTTAGIATFGPTAAAARIESSKAFCHDVAAAAGVRMAESRVCGSVDETMEAIRLLADAGRGFVIKEDGLAAGKGVAVHAAADAGDVRDHVEAVFAAAPAAPVIVEERLEGLEASVIAICDGRDALALPAARDHKRLLDGDEGPNTGGMGAFSPLPDLDDEAVARIVATIHRPILAELARRGNPFVGALYAGLMLTADGPILLECNARFGDPETQVILPRVATALGPLLRAAAHRELGAAAVALGLPLDGLLPTMRAAAVGIVLAGAGYPGSRSDGERIEGIEEARRAGAFVFHAGTRTGAETGRGFETRGGRILTVVARGRDLAAARDVAESAADAISWPGMQRRRDIAAILPEPLAAGAAR
jgi:phosphoribosylamine--glycine ligase